MIKLTFFVCFSLSTLIPIVTLAGSYYVTQNGSGSRSGLNPANAWSVNNFNNSSNWSAVQNSEKISPGDMVYFSGTITSPLIIQGSGNSSDGYITLDGYEDGDCNPINEVCSSAAFLTGRNNRAISVNGQNYIRIQDMRMGTLRTGIFHYSTSSVKTAHNIIISRVEIDTVADKGIQFTTPSSNYRSSYLTIEDSVIVDTAEGNNDSACAAILINAVDDVIIRRNHIYNRPAYTPVANGADGIVTLYCNRMLIEYNRIHRMGEDGIDFKSYGASYSGTYGGVIIRYNVIYDMPFQTGITLQHEAGSNAYVYGNLIYGRINWYPVLVQRGFKDVFIWSNIIYGGDRAGIAVYNQDPKRPVDRVHSFNNTIVRNGIESTSRYHAGIRYDQAETIHSVKNNILVKNNQNHTNKNQLSYTWSAARNTDSDYNLFWYSPTVSPTLYHDATTYSLTHPVSGTTYHINTGLDGNSTVGDPNFVDIAANDFRLTEDSLLAIGTGVDLSSPPSGWSPPTIQGTNYSNQISLAIGINPNGTDWRTTPPKVNTINRNEIGSWDKGAYVYSEYNSGVGRSLLAPKGVFIEPVILKD